MRRPGLTDALKTIDLDVPNRRSSGTEVSRLAAVVAPKALWGQRRLRSQTWAVKDAPASFITQLPSLDRLLLPNGLELLPNTTELFELELAYHESRLLSRPGLVRRSAFLKSVDGQSTHHYRICRQSSSATWEGRSNRTRAYFREGNFSTGYATHGLFPYRGKFHPQLVRALLNLLQMQSGHVVLDPMCGSGTLNVEAALLGIDSVGVEASPFCVLMSTVKHNAMSASDVELAKSPRTHLSV